MDITFATLSPALQVERTRTLGKHLAAARFLNSIEKSRYLRAVKQRNIILHIIRRKGCQTTGRTQLVQRIQTFSRVQTILRLGIDQIHLGDTEHLRSVAINQRSRIGLEILVTAELTNKNSDPLISTDRNIGILNKENIRTEIGIFEQLDYAAPEYR